MSQTPPTDPASATAAAEGSGEGAAEKAAEASAVPPTSRSRKPSVSTCATSVSSGGQRATSRPPTPPLMPAARAAPAEIPNPPPPDIYIAVLGQTGTGKSTFINNVLGQSKEFTPEGVKLMGVGHSLDACTASIEVASTTINGHKVHLIDTLGFDESERNDGDILILVSKWLKGAHSENKLLSGVVYLHRVSDRRMQWGSVRSLNILKKLCGKSTYEHISLATTMWQDIDIIKGSEREEELKKKWWSEVIAGGGQIYRHDKEVTSARKIIADMLPKDPILLDIQREIAVNDIIATTTAGKYVHDYMRKRVELLEHVRQADAERIKELEAESKGKELEKQKIEAEKKGLEEALVETRKKVNGLEEQMKRLTTKMGVLEKMPLEEAKSESEVTFLGRLQTIWRSVTE